MPDKNPTIVEVPTNHLRHTVLYEFKKGNSAAEAARNVRMNKFAEDGLRNSKVDFSLLKMKIKADI